MTAGILHPKLAYRFKTFFIANVGDAEQEATDEILKALENQALAVQLPKRVTKDWINANYQSTASIGVGKKRNYFKGVYSVGDLLITVEDDAANKVSTAIELLTKLQGMSIVVANLDGEENIIDAHLFTNVRFMSVEYTGFDYRQVGSGTGLITPAGVGGGTPPPTVINVMHPERSQTQLKKLTFAPTHAQYYYHKTGDAFLHQNTLLGDI